MNYRNKAQFQLRQIDGQVEAGLYQADSHQLVPIDNCLVQQPATTKVMNTLVDLLNDFHYQFMMNVKIVVSFEH